MKKARLIYGIEGMLYSDHQAEFVASKLAKGINVFTSSGVVVEAALTLIAEEKLDYRSIEIYFEDQLLYVNEYGVITNPPKGFLDTSTDLVIRRVKRGIERRKALREGR